MSNKQYDEARYHVDDEYDEHRRSSSRRRSTSRSRHRAQPVEDHYYRRSGSGSSISSVSDYDYRTQCTERPMVRCPKETIRAPTPPPIIQRVVERAPTPEADVYERIIIRPQPQQLIERIIERPRTPPPKIIEKEICEAAPPPIVRTRIVKVDHSPRHYANNNSRILYTPSQPRCNYGPCPPDYELADRSYSNSYSTSDMYQPTMGAVGYQPSAYMPSMYGQQAQVASMSVPQQQAYGAPYAGAYNYGYSANYTKPAATPGYAPSQLAPASYPRQY